MMAVISLTTDFSSRDPYIGMMKGVIAGINPAANVIDLAHDLPAQDVRAACFVLKGAFHYFPPGTIHVAVVDPGVGMARAVLCAHAQRHTFLAPDNGLLSFLWTGEHEAKVYRVKNHRFFLSHVSNTFHGRDVFAPVAGHLSLGTPPGEMGPGVADCVTLDLPDVSFNGNSDLTGEVVYVDGFGNLVTNITRWHLGELHHFAPERAHVRIGHAKVDRLLDTYGQVDRGQILALMSSFGHLEIAANGTSAASVLKCGAGARVSVRCGP
jgi:S-adenosylmethionine hydrolase